MTVSVRIEGVEGLEKASAEIKASASTLKEELLRAAQKFAQDAVRRSMNDYLTGPRPDKLGVVSNRLRSSIKGEVTEDGRDIDIRIGTNVVYAKAHEFGYSGSVNVSAHSRVVSKVFGRDVGSVTQHVSSHTRKVNLQARPFLRPAIEDALPGFEESIGRVLMNVWRGV